LTCAWTVCLCTGGNENCWPWWHYAGRVDRAFHPCRETKPMSTPLQIGFSQRVQLDWLEQTAALVLAGLTREQIETRLQELLHDKLSIGGAAQRGNREKAITILLKIWVSVPPWLQPLRDGGLDHLRRL